MKTTRAHQWFAGLVAVGLLSGCSGWQSALDPASEEASRLSDLIIGFTVLLGVIWLAVMIAVVAALRRRRGRLEQPEVFAVETDAPAELRITALAVATGVI